MIKKLTLSAVAFSLITIANTQTSAEGYLNEYYVVFTSVMDAEDDPWKNNPKCTPIIKATEDKGIWNVQYQYANGSQLTSEYRSTIKPKAGECQTFIHLPEEITGSGTFESYFPNGKQRARIDYKDGVYNGKMQFWFANGLKEQENTVIDEVSQGEYKIWHPNGQLGLSMRYKDGVQTGTRQRWYENGEPWTEVRFENDKMVGPLKQWFRNGKLERLGNYRNGVRHGEYKVWFEEGQPEAVLNYQAGQITTAQCWNEHGVEISQQACIQRFKGED